MAAAVNGVCSESCEHVRGNFPAMKNNLFLKAARGETVDRVPVWVMRQAGRYLPEFNKVREQHGFFDVCRTPELVCKVTLQPIDRYDLDASIIFSDILVIPQAMGLEVNMVPGKGPVFPNPINSPEDIKELLVKEIDVKKQLKYVFDGITLTRHRLGGRVPLIGFSGAPWTLMAYMIEGSGSKTYSKAKKWLYQHQKESQKFLKYITNIIVEYLVEQVRAGAQALQVFESHAELLSQQCFSLYCLPYLKEIATRVKQELGDDAVPMIVFAKGGFYAMSDFTNSHYDVIGVDWAMNPTECRTSAPGKTLQGNMDPCALYGNKDDLRETVKSMLKQFGTHRYIANLGHGIYPDVDPENLAVFINAVHEYSKEMISSE